MTGQLNVTGKFTCKTNPVLFTLPPFQFTRSNPRKSTCRHALPVVFLLAGGTSLFCSTSPYCLGFRNG